MSVPPRRRLPERPSLEQLRKQAKEHLDTLRAGDPSVNLAAAQHALAREYGFDSWPKLVHHVETVHPANRMLQPAELKSDQKLVWSPGRGTDVWALMQACTSGDLERVRALIAEDPSLARSHYDYRKPLYFAVRENRIDIVQFLLEHDRNPIDLWVDDDPIEIARDRGYTEMEQLLAHTLETTFNASAKGEPVALSLRNHDLQQMNELLDAQPELVGKGDRRSNQPIHWATMTRQLDAIDELLRRGADINARRMDGGRPIHLTNGDYFYRGWRDVPRHWPVTAAQVMAYLKARGAFIDQLLLERGAFPNPPVESSGDALWWSRERRPDKRMEQLLLSYGAKPTKGHTGEDWPQEAYNWLRISPPHQAARKGDVPEAKKLLEAGADLTARDEHLRSTSLAWAAKFGQLEMVKFLLGRGMPKSLPDDADWATPRAWAIRRGHEEVARLLS
jgi:ankyrin repeat protein